MLTTEPPGRGYNVDQIWKSFSTTEENIAGKNGLCWLSTIIGKSSSLLHYKEWSNIKIFKPPDEELDWLKVWCLTHSQQNCHYIAAASPPVHAFHEIISTSTLHNIPSKPLAAFPHNHCQNSASREEWILSQWLSSILRRVSNQQPPVLKSSELLSYGALLLMWKQCVKELINFSTGWHHADWWLKDPVQLKPGASRLQTLHSSHRGQPVR